jgi:hypothetical protein
MDADAVVFLRGGNTKGAIYMEFDGSSTNATGDFIDPWYDVNRHPNNIYQISLGENGLMTLPSGGTIPREVGAWSRGRDGQNDAATGGDDVKSWE